MLSILIPTYNYNVYPLVLELKKQADSLDLKYEILVQDDNSTETYENSTINSLTNCNFSVNQVNLGRGKNINLLCTKSKYDYVLIMEADSLPENKLYLKNFVDSITNSTTIIFGGVKYPDNKPTKEKMLRWKYGKKRETKSLKHRQKFNYDFVFTWNLVLRKEILLKYPFPEYITEYGYEDVIFIKTLQSNAISINHIENFLIHHNDEFSIDFIKKKQSSVTNLHSLITHNKIEYKDINLSAVYLFLKKLRIIGIVKLIYLKIRPKIIVNLTSENPNLYLLDFYKLGYYCTIQDSKNV
ncbi:glycosyltransferase [Flavobacterium sp. NG2]|uniref:glycosyltransferase family 2 protein n=1 Tax=Flavobacterium sp. NG2 TaxID=3097547 RepID=UPI002A7FB70B|nr:glycosyltransferase [Flavobacterium sp. NG2]WPR70206.1 glycosyltransferase [Flavobacterium sp. NG2]